MNETLRTDALLHELTRNYRIVAKEMIDLCRQLERELTDARAALADRSEEYVIRQAEAESELIAACEERDRFRKDSEVLDWFIQHMPWDKDELIDYFNFLERNNTCCPKHLRNRLEGKKT